MKIFRSEQIKKIDTYTIDHESIASADLMERAAGKLLSWFVDTFDRSGSVHIFSGPGNNGGDGLALARMLAVNRYKVEVSYVDFTRNTSEDWKINFSRLKNETKVPVNILTSADHFPEIYSGDIIIDAIFGSGLTRPVEGLPGEIIKLINLIDIPVISIDIPSGLFGEDNSKNTYECVIEADFTLSFQFPKLSFMFPENSDYVGEWIILPIGLNNEAISKTQTPYSFIENSDALLLLKKRNKFDHKGNFGHGLLVSGSSGKMGAAVLGARAALRTGIGLITCHVPLCGQIILQTALPEAMVNADKSEDHITDIGDTDIFSAVGVGPGFGTDPESQNAFFRLLSDCNKPMVIDADALNIISANRDWLTKIKPGTILTPHMKEFERLSGERLIGFNRLSKQVEFSKTYNCIVVLKGAHTSVTIPDGSVYFNSTGNPGMATGGSGDILTGIILSLLAQGYKAENAALLGVYLHGLAGDIAAEDSCYESIIPSDIINCAGKAFNRIRAGM